MDPEAAKPQAVSLEWRDSMKERYLQGAKNVYDDDGKSDCLCDVITINPPMRLPWRYTEHQAQEGKVWACDALWFLDRRPRRQHGGEEIRQRYLVLEKAINRIAQNKEGVRYSLLVNERGMCYSSARVGGDHHVSADGWNFTFSVRRHAETGDMCMLAVMHP
jgi:hypothetical protein